MSEKKKISMRASGPEQNTDAEDARSKKRSVHGSEKNESIGLFFRRSQKSIQVEIVLRNPLITELFYYVIFD